MKPAPAVRDDARGTNVPRYELIERMFFAYRDFVADADRALAGDGFGRAHHRVLYFTARRPGLTVAALLDILKITKQSLNRVLKDLLDRGYVVNRLGEADRRQRRLYPTARGSALIERIVEVQSARFARAFASLGPDAEARAGAFLAAMMDEGAGVHDPEALPDGPRKVTRIGLVEGTVEVQADNGRLGEVETAKLFGTKS